MLGPYTLMCRIGSSGYNGFPPPLFCSHFFLSYLCASHLLLTLMTIRILEVKLARTLHSLLLRDVAVVMVTIWVFLAHAISPLSLWLGWLIIIK